MSNLSIKCLTNEKAENGTLYSQFVIYKLACNQGLTIGNLFRRVLLNDLNGTTITGLRIAGINHEFSTIEGIREDILELLLNLKGIVIKGYLSEPKFGRLKVQGPSIVHADQIELPSGLKVINSNHYIATSSTQNMIEIELKFESGTGYRLANQMITDKSDNFLQIDAVFMPVQKVNFKIENVYDKTAEITENLILDIWTNGSITPEMAIYETSQTIIDLLTSLIVNKNDSEINIDYSESVTNTFDPYANMAIEELQLSVRAYNCLKRAKINTIGDLLKYSPEKLQELKNFGRKSADEVFVTLKTKLGIILK